MVGGQLGKDLKTAFISPENSCLGGSPQERGKRAERVPKQQPNVSRTVKFIGKMGSWAEKGMQLSYQS